MGTMLRVAIVAIIGAIWYNVMTGPVLVYSEAVSEKSQIDILHEAITNLTRDMVKSNDSSGPRVCYPNESCGWVVYKDYDRNIHSTTMRSTCVCKDSSYKCVRRDDNMKIYAYEYKCAQNTTEYDLLLPSDAI